MFRKLLTALFFQACFYAAQAQTGISKWQAGIAGGAAVYMGDLTPSVTGAFKMASPTLQLYVNRVLNPYFAIRANVTIGALRGDDSAYSNPAWRRQRNFMFSTPLTEASALMVWSPYGNHNNELGLKITPYILAGAGMAFVNISRDYSRMNREVFSEGTKAQQGLIIDSAHALPSVLPVLPFGAGLQYYISSKLSFTAEALVRFTFTDYLDGFKYAANPDRGDMYHTLTLGLLFRFGGKSNTDCPVMKY
jgi:hypothetical protein